jgi:hypothetical protein
VISYSPSRLVWDKAGYEVAANRGTVPDGVQFTGDICTDAYNLGCDGMAVFDIVDESGTVLKLREGDHLVVQTRGKETCGEEFADDVEGMICLHPAAAAAGDLNSCTWPLPLDPLNKSLYGPDRFGGTLGTVLMQ